MNICVVGSGYVGLVTGACFADFGLNVTCVDKDPEKIEMLSRGEIPIYEPGLKELVSKNAGQGHLTFTTDLSGAIKNSLVIFIAVGTPPKEDGSADLVYVKEVARTIAENLNEYKVIVTKSTVPVGTGKIIEEIIRAEAKGEAHFDVASNPEFLREGSAIEDFMRPDRVVIGTKNPQAVAILKDLYSPLYLIETPFVVADVETAELIKYVSNAFLATKISFINEVAELCERTGADVHVVAKAMGLDKRIGSKFLHPGPGFGGSCFPKDTSAVLQMAEKLGYDFKIVRSLIEVNSERSGRMVEKIEKAMGGSEGDTGVTSIKGKTIAVLGLTFKPNTDDIRESPAIDIVRGLVEKGAVVRVYDPAGMDNARDELAATVTYCEDPYEAASEASCLVLITEWNQFRMLDMGRIKNLLKNPVMVDLRNIYEPKAMREAGFEYTSVGR